jgi:lysyl-tRNA synthetase class I
MRLFLGKRKTGIEVNIISRYSGKCDWCDSLEIHNYTLEELQNNVKIYIGNNQEPLHISKMSDMIPYYPYLISIACFNNAERKSIIHLSSESFVDREEKECLEFMLGYLLRIYNRCKRKKIEFNVDEALREIVWNGWNEEAYRELANRVKENGKKATIDGIHLRMHEIYRRELASEMIKNGLNPNDYGYGRFVDKNE